MVTAPPHHARILTAASGLRQPDAEAIVLTGMGGSLASCMALQAEGACLDDPLQQRCLRSISWSLAVSDTVCNGLLRTDFELSIVYLFDAKSNNDAENNRAR